MSTAHLLLSLIVVTAPGLVFVSEGVAQHAFMLSAAAALLFAAMSSRAELATTSEILRRIALALLVPILWMLLQIVPLPSALLGNPVWSAASIALNQSPSWAPVSVDPGATLHSLAIYLAALATVIATTIVARDRQRAETIFVVLSALTALMAIPIALDGWFSAVSSRDRATVAFGAASAIGMIANIALVLMAVGRLVRRSPSSSSASLYFRLAFGIFGCAICAIALLRHAPVPLLASVLASVAAMIFVGLARQLSIRPWLSVTLFVTLAALSIGLIVPKLQPDGEPLRIASFAKAPSATVALAERTLSTSPTFGYGAGTYATLANVFRDYETQPNPAAPSTAIAIVTEWGLLGLLVICAIALYLFIYLFRGALRRGRDSYFSNAAAAGILLATLQVFIDSSLLSPTVQIIIVALIGLGISQSVGRTSGFDD